MKSFYYLIGYLTSHILIIILIYKIIYKIFNKCDANHDDMARQGATKCNKCGEEI